jgi:ABC-2 type transport system permease protein
MIARATTYWTMLKICLEERLVYRGDFALGTLMRFLPIVTQVFLWGAIFASIDAGKTVVGYTYRDMIAYYLLAMVTRAFSSMPGLASGIAVQIRNGEIKKGIGLFKEIAEALADIDDVQRRTDLGLR